MQSDWSPVRDLSWSTFEVAAFVALVFAIVGTVVMIAWIIAILATEGVAFLLIFVYPFFGYFILWVTAQFMTSSLQLHGFWLTTLCGFLLLVVGIPESSKKSSDHSSSNNYTWPRKTRTSHRPPWAMQVSRAKPATPQWSNTPERGLPGDR